MAYQNLNTYSRSDVKKPKVIVESVKSDTIYTPLWINNYCNNMEFKKSLFSRYYLNDARINSVFSMNENELQDTTEIVMKVVNSLYGDSIAQQLGLTTDKLVKYSSTLNNNTVSPKEALRRWNINDYMAMGNSYPYNCVFNLMENAPPLRSLLPVQKVTTSEFSRKTVLITNTSSSTNNMTFDKMSCCRYLNITKINRETQTSDNVPVNCRQEPLVSLEVTTYANGTLANISCPNKTNETSSLQKTKLFFAVTEYQKLLSVLQRMAAGRTETTSLQRSTDLDNKYNSYANRNTNSIAQTRNIENIFTYTGMIKNSNLIQQHNSPSMSSNQKYCVTTYTSTETKSNIFQPDLANTCPCNGFSRNVVYRRQRCTNFSNQNQKKSQLNSRGRSKENLRQNKLIKKRTALTPLQNSYDLNRSYEDLNCFFLNMKNQKNSKVQQSRKKIVYIKKNNNLDSQKNKIQSGSVPKKQVLAIKKRKNVEVIPLASTTTTTVKKSDTNDQPLINTMDVIDWIEENCETLNTVQCGKSVTEIQEDLLKEVSKVEKEFNNESVEHQSLSEKAETEKDFFVKENVEIDEQTKPSTKKETNILEKLLQKSHNDKSTQEKDQNEISSTEADKNKNETGHENMDERLKDETISTEENLCMSSNKAIPVSGQVKTTSDNKPNLISDQDITTPSPEDGKEHQKNDVSAEGTVLLPNSSEDSNQKAYPYNLRKRKPVVYFYPSVFRRIVPKTENKKAKRPKYNKKETN